jgi:hypothetical protein
MSTGMFPSRLPGTGSGVGLGAVDRLAEPTARRASAVDALVHRTVLELATAAGQRIILPVSRSSSQPC